MAWAPDPNRKRVIRANGSGAMGTLLDRSDMTARFRFPQFEIGTANPRALPQPFVLTQIQVLFDGSGDLGLNDMELWLDHPTRKDGIASPFDFRIEWWQNVGVDSSDGRGKICRLVSYRGGVPSVYLLPWLGAGVYQDGLAWHDRLGNRNSL